MVALVYVKLTYKYENVLNFYRFKFRYDKTAAIDSKEFIRIGKHTRFSLKSLSKQNWATLPNLFAIVTISYCYFLEYYIMK